MISSDHSQLDRQLLASIKSYVAEDISSTQQMVSHFHRLSPLEKLVFFQQNIVQELQTQHQIDLVEYYNCTFVQKYAAEEELDVDSIQLAIGTLRSRHCSQYQIRSSMMDFARKNAYGPKNTQMLEQELFKNMELSICSKQI